MIDVPENFGEIVRVSVEEFWEAVRVSRGHAYELYQQEVSRKRGLREQIEVALNPDNPRVPAGFDPDQDAEDYLALVEKCGQYHLTEHQKEIVKQWYKAPRIDPFLRGRKIL